MTSIDKYIEYHTNNATHWEIDTHLDAAVYFADKWGLSQEDRCWFAFLTTICETTPTAMYLFSHFPTLHSTDTDAFKRFTLENKQAMAFQYDVRWILYNIDKTLNDYKQIVGNGKQTDALTRLATGATPSDRWRNLTHRFSVHRFKNYVFMLYTELLHHLIGIEMEATLDPRTNHSVRSGLISASGFNDAIKCTTKGSKPTAEETQLLNASLNEIYDIIRQSDINPRHKTTWAIETTLCTYNKTLHGRRYLGFYKERQRKEIQRLNDYTNSIGEAFDWSELWEYHNNWGNWNNKYR